MRRASQRVGSLWLSKATGSFDPSRWFVYPYFQETLEQYGDVIPGKVEVHRDHFADFTRYGFDDATAEDDWAFVDEVKQKLLAGEDVPPLVRQNGRPFDGIHRAWAAKLIGWRTAPVFNLEAEEVDPKPPRKARRYIRPRARLRPRAPKLRSRRAKQTVKLLDPDRAPRQIEAELEPATDHAIEAGAHAPLSYVGAGMTGIVFADKLKRRAYKVARSPVAKRTMSEEVEWFQAAERDPFVSKYVLPRVKWDEKAGVRISPYMHGDHPRWKDEEQVRKLHEQIEKHMLKHGWTAPEYKPDSYVMTNTGPVLVDASMPQRVGRTLIRYTNDILEERRPAHGFDDSPTQLAYYVRREIKTERNPQGTIELDEGLATLARLKAAGATEWTDL